MNCLNNCFAYDPNTGTYDKECSMSKVKTKFSNFYRCMCEMGYYSNNLECKGLLVLLFILFLLNFNFNIFYNKIKLVQLLVHYVIRIGIVLINVFM
jgi:hypothetical protein